MKQRLHIIILLVVAILVGSTGGDTKNEELVGDFNQIMHQADSLYNSMEFRTAYDLYLQLLDNKEAKADDEKMLNVLNSLCMASELAGHKAEQTKWMQQLLDLAKQTGNAYYESLGLLAMGKRIFYEGDRQQGIQYVSEAIDLMAKTDRIDTDHLTHSQMMCYCSTGIFFVVLRLIIKSSRLHAYDNYYHHHPAYGCRRGTRSLVGLAHLAQSAPERRTAEEERGHRPRGATPLGFRGDAWHV